MGSHLREGEVEICFFMATEQVGLAFLEGNEATRFNP
jgi:hypothetical protein